MSSTSLAKESRIDRAAARLDSAISRLDTVVGGIKAAPASPDNTEALAKLEAENESLKGLNREAADRLADAIRRLEIVAGQGS